MRTWRDLHPTGKKNCSQCGRWRHVVDFTVRLWADEPYCTIPRYLHSWCRRCMAANRRQKKGYKPGDHYQHGTPGSQSHREHTRRRNKASRDKRMKNRKYREGLNEYHRIWRAAKKAEPQKEQERLSEIMELPPGTL